jgi:hypothetical protein
VYIFDHFADGKLGHGGKREENAASHPNIDSLANEIRFY